MSIAKLCRTQVVTIDAQDNICQAAKLMKQHNIGDVIVMDNGKIRGILTDRDIVIKLAADQINLDEVKVSDVMSGNGDLLVLEEKKGIAETIQALRDKGVRRAPIIDDSGKVTGIATVDDLLILMATELKTLSEIIENQVLQ